MTTTLFGPRTPSCLLAAGDSHDSDLARSIVEFETTERASIVTSSTDDELMRVRLRIIQDQLLALDRREVIDAAIAASADSEDAESRLLALDIGLSVWGAGRILQMQRADLTKDRVRELRNQERELRAVIDRLG